MIGKPYPAIVITGTEAGGNFHAVGVQPFRQIGPDRSAVRIHLDRGAKDGAEQIVHCPGAVRDLIACFVGCGQIGTAGGIFHIADQRDHIAFQIDQRIAENGAVRGSIEQPDMRHGTDHRTARSIKQISRIRFGRLEDHNIIMDRTGNNAGGGILRAAGGIAEDNTVADPHNGSFSVSGIDRTATRSGIVASHRHAGKQHGCRSGRTDRAAVTAGTVAVEGRIADRSTTVLFQIKRTAVAIRRVVDKGTVRDYEGTAGERTAVPGKIVILEETVIHNAKRRITIIIN